MSCSNTDQQHHYASSELSMQPNTLQRLPNTIAYPSKYRTRMDKGPIYKPQPSNENVCPCCSPTTMSDQQMEMGANMMYGPSNGPGCQMGGGVGPDMYHHYPLSQSPTYYQEQQHCVFHATSAPPVSDIFFTPSPSVQPFLPARQMSPVRLTPFCTCQHAPISLRDEHFYSVSSAGSEDDHAIVFPKQNCCNCDSPQKPARKNTEVNDLRRELQKACHKCDMQAIQEARNYVVRHLLQQAIGLMGDDGELCKCSGDSTEHMESCEEEESVHPMKITNGEEGESQADIAENAENAENAEENSHCEVCEEAAKLFEQQMVEQQALTCPPATITIPICSFPCAIFFKPNADYTDFSTTQVPLQNLNFGPQGFRAPFGVAPIGAMGPMGQMGQMGQMGPMGPTGSLGTMGPVRPMAQNLEQSDSVYFGSCDGECNDEVTVVATVSKGAMPETEATAGQSKSQAEIKEDQPKEEVSNENPEQVEPEPQQEEQPKEEEPVQEDPPNEEPPIEEPPIEEPPIEEPPIEEPPKEESLEEVPPQEEQTPAEAVAESEPQLQSESQINVKRSSTSSQRPTSVTRDTKQSEHQAECDPERGGTLYGEDMAEYECELDDAECEAARAELYKKLQPGRKRASCSTAGGGATGGLGEANDMPCDCCHCRAVRSSANRDTPDPSMAVARIQQTCGGSCAGGGASGTSIEPTGAKGGPRPDYREMKFFIDSLVLDFDVMEAVQKERQQKKSPGARSSRKAVTRPHPLCQRPSFPVTITNVSNVGSKSLFVKWEIHDCSGIGGYEIYLDNCFYNRYRNSNHQAALIYNVNIRQEHTITLRAVPHDEITSPKDCSCGDGGKKGIGAFAALFSRLQSSSKPDWTPSVYLYDPNERGMLKCPPPKSTC